MVKANVAEERERAEEILLRLKKEYPDAGPRLKFDNPYQALVAIMLSAQTNDDRVNAVTPELFRRYPDPCSLAAADLKEVEDIIRPVGLYRSKTANLLSTAAIICTRYQGQIPQDFDSLLELPGVGRKTANVWLATAVKRPGLGVDTHVQRVSFRLGLSDSQRPHVTEKILKNLLDPSSWALAHHLFIFHGRNVCKAKKPKCSDCILRDLCAYPGH